MARRVALLSDIHGHLVALRAVLADLEAAGVREIAVAGDIVNFGPNSVEVVDLLWERGARMIRGNHEQELVATYGTAAMPREVASFPGWGTTRWCMEQLGPERRAFLAGLPDRLALDEATVVVHGSPRHVRDAVLAARTDDELAAMFAGEPADVTVAFVGHTHRPLLRDLPPRSGMPPRRFVNVGSAGSPADGDPRACYAIAERGPSGAPGDWRVEVRRVPYDVDAAIAAYGNGLRQAHPEFVELFARALCTGRNYLGPGFRAITGLPHDEVLPALRRFLAHNP